MSIIDAAIESVMDLIDSMDNYALIRRGALGTGNGLCCEIGPSAPESVYLDKNQYIILDLTLNGKHTNMQILSDTMNRIHEVLTMLREYPQSDEWKIVDITTLTEPQIIGREADGAWMMASALNVKVYTSKEAE
jgi:hypothetical protein